ncbi:response regulator [Ferruginibacter sp. SUN106]|uniref:response regulator n=1 Tax=Ferruginibacter sp. SUN106 TaxID=2978348 RepID=UPI003D36D6FC
MINPLDLSSFNGIIVDDHELFGHGFAMILKSMAFNNSLHFTNIERAMNELQANNYNVLFIDLQMPGTDTKEFITTCRKKYPYLTIIIVSTIAEINRVKECFTWGVDGYISKSVSVFELNLALERTYAGDKYVSSDLNSKLANSLFFPAQTNLTAKELVVLKLIAQGYKVDKISEILFISTYTVLAHRRNIMKKLDLHTAAELVKYVFTNNLN